MRIIQKQSREPAFWKLFSLEIGVRRDICKTGFLRWGFLACMPSCVIENLSTITSLLIILTSDLGICFCQILKIINTCFIIFKSILLYILIFYIKVKLPLSLYSYLFWVSFNRGRYLLRLLLKKLLFTEAPLLGMKTNGLQPWLYIRKPESFKNADAWNQLSHHDLGVGDDVQATRICRKLPM